MAGKGVSLKNNSIGISLFEVYPYFYAVNSIAMKLHLYVLTFIFVLLALPAASQNYIPLDSSDPIAFYGNRIVYQGKEVVLGKRSIFVDGQLSAEEAARHPYVFSSFQDAAQCFEDGTEDAPMCVYIAPYVYWIDNPDDPAVRKGKEGREPFGMVVKCDYLHLVGLNTDPRNVVLAANRGQTQGAVGNFTMFDFWGDGLLVKNLTMGNFCNVDLEFPLQPQLNRSKRMSAITQAHVAYSHGDKVMAENVRFISRLNMNPLNGARRILFKDCHMESTDDALTGNGVYLGCTLHFYAPRPFWRTDWGGAVFLDCDFTICHEGGSQYFCKAVGPLSVVDCRFHAANDSLYVGWAASPTQWLRCYQSGVTLNSQPYVIGNKNVVNTISIDEAPALQAYHVERDGKKVYNTYNLLCGEDGWDPLQVKSLVAGNYQVATCLAVAPLEATLQTGEAPIELTATLKRHSNYTLNNKPVRWSVSAGDEGVVALSTTDGYHCKVQATYHDDAPRRISIIASTEDGLQGATELTVLPGYVAAPSFVKRPAIATHQDTLWLNYQLDLQGREDQSLVTWYRCKDKKGADALPVAVSRMGRPLLAYPLTVDDAGYYILAAVQPKHQRCLPGEAVSAVTSKPIRLKSAAPIRELQTSFVNFPTTNQSAIIPGFWTIGGYKPIDTQGFDWEVYPDTPYWYYGEGINGATGLGLLQCQRGARLLYTPLEAPYGDMSLELLVDPCKTAGQGFGSATGQYMDIYIKMDTKTLSGYALRIERTTKYSNAVDFTLMEYNNGIATAICEPISAICYRTGCTIRLSAKGNRLVAQVDTTTPLATPKDPNLHTQIYLQADIIPNTQGGIGLQHTGTWGENATMLKHLSVEWGE